MQQAISSVLVPGYRRRVLGLLLRPDEALHGREEGGSKTKCSQYGRRYRATEGSIGRVALPA